MKITPRLNIDVDVENIPSGELAHASNIVINNTNNAILTENAIKEFYSLDDDESIVGRIACSDEFILFTSNNRIVRVNEKDGTKIPIQTNWGWQGGEVIGTYTYNANQELIIAISERIDYKNEQVPLKIINLDNPNYIEDDTDNKYTLSPNIPKYNLIGYSFENGNYIDKGVYNFFIRFKIADDYTAWFYLGYPINVYNTSNTEIIEKVYYSYRKYEGVYGNELVDRIDNFEYKVKCDDGANNVSKNIYLNIRIELTDINYESYQIGYIVSTIENETKVYTTQNYNIDNAVVVIDCKNYDDISVDEMTRNSFNIFNAKTICNYNNRLYLANYNEENPNAKLEDIDLSNITVKATSYQGNPIETTSLVETYNNINDNIINRSTTRTSQSSISRITPTEFLTNKGYIVDMYMAFITENSGGERTTAKRNFKLFVNRFCNVNGDTRLLIKVADILAASSAASGSIGHSTNFIFDVDYNPNIYNECKFVCVEAYENQYRIRFISDSNNLENYPIDTNPVNINAIITTGGGYNSNEFKYGFKANMSIAQNNPHANVAYKYSDNATVETSDLFITSITEVELPDDALNTLEPCWFYKGRLALDDDTFDTNELYSNDISKCNPYYTTFPVIQDSNIIYYNYSGAFTYSALVDENFVYNKLKETYPNCTFKFYRYCVNANGQDNLTESNYKLEEEINPEAERYKSYITIGCAKLSNNTITKFNLIKVEYDAYDINHYVILSNKFTVIDADATETEHNIEDIFSTINFQYLRINYDVQNFVDYWNDGGDKGYITTYQWREDRQPTASDFNPDELYNVDFGKLQAINYDDDTKASIFPDVQSTRIRLYNLSPIAVGFRNIGEEDPSTHVVQVDKDFCIVIPLTQFANYLTDNAPNVNEMIALRNYDNVIDRNYYNKYYVLFRLQDVYTVESNTDIVGHLCTIYNDTPINSAVPVFKKILDTTYQCTWLDYPGFTRNDTTSVFLSQPLFFIREQTTSQLSDLTSNVQISEYSKVAINHAVYNFFIHFVYPNGNYTDGVKIPCNLTYSYNLPIITSLDDDNDKTFSYSCDENTTVGDIKLATRQWINDNNGIVAVYDEYHRIDTFFDINDDLRICNIYPQYNQNNVALYINSVGEKFFRGADEDCNVPSKYNIIKPIKFEFENIPIIDGFVGYFISYEKPEHILLGRGPLIAENNDFNTVYDSMYNYARFYYPEFNITKKAAGSNCLYVEEYPLGGTANRGNMFVDAYEIDTNYNYIADSTKYNKTRIVAVESSELLIPDDNIDNGGREGCLKLNFPIKVGIRSIEINDRSKNIHKYHSFGILLAITNNIYINKNKELIPLGYIKYYNDAANPNTYGKESFAYNYDYYNNTDINVIAFNKDGVVYDEVNYVPTYYNTDNIKNNDDRYLYLNYEVLDGRKGCSPICRIIYDSYNDFDVKAIQIDNTPTQHYYTIYRDIDNAENEDNNDIRNINTIYIYPQYANDLFKYSSIYNTYTTKLMINYDEEVYSNFITYYGKTIRRSNVMSDESIENRWRIFNADDYKIIVENKGNIMNVVGVGAYLIAHCEHSLFVFNRDNQLKTTDKDVQMLIPDTFEINYTEVFPTDKGCCGLQNFNQWCVSNYGYIFLDKDSKKIYQWDNDNLTELTIGMKNLFIHIDDCRFAVDTNNDRLICIGSCSLPVEDNKFTISYSFIIKDWISTHTYWYDDLFNTKNNIYFINNNIINTFDLEHYNNYTNTIDDVNNVFKSEIYDNIPNSYIDVVFNNNGVDKVLDYISYCINKATDDTYSGNKLLIYTNVCYSNYCDISKSRKSVKDYKNPVFRFGIWIYNWFRNYVLNINTIEPIIRGNGKFALETTDLGKQINNNALIVGKYFVIRIIFADQDKRISINDIQCY